ncbi:MAG: phosphatase PAP2 family protein [Jatrophihabitantaceae bacterium]
MHNYALTWQQAAVVTVALAAVYAVLRGAKSSITDRIAPFAGESCLIAALYSVWQLAGNLSVTGTSHAYARGAWIARVEHDVHLPSEASVQRLITGHPLLTQGANLYYASMHFTALFIFLVWLFAWHRDRYSAIRTTLALTTLACLLVQLLPVAPPRLLPGYVDTAAQYGQSVYNLGFGADELSAMPSVHVAWAVLIGWYVARVSRSRWRWLGAAHAVLTVFVVVATANHWWLDGIVAVAMLIACAWLRLGAARLIVAARAPGRPQVTEPLPAVAATRRADTGSQA